MDHFNFLLMKNRLSHLGSGKFEIGRIFYIAIVNFIGNFFFQNRDSFEKLAQTFITGSSSDLKTPPDSLKKSTLALFFVTGLERTL